jgi:formate hydrogenlyase subunit 6/NADH:ubiquinone oxidoreductase subunit I
MRLPGRMLGEALRHVARKPATTAYPAVPAVSPPDFRGKIRFSGEKCTGCKLCEKDCPSHAILINKVGEKRYEAVFELDRCIYCGQCVDSCNRDSLEITPEFELAALNRAALRIVYEAPPAPPAPPASATPSGAAPAPSGSAPPAPPASAAR